MGYFSFCPNTACLYHQKAPSERWYVALGHYHTKCFGDVPRYRCKACGRIFSAQTFSINYFAKKDLSYAHLERLLASSMSQRALARHFMVSLGTIANRIGRLSRQTLALHHRLCPQAHPSEPVCIDGFVSFDHSQYFPNNCTIAISAQSQYILALTHATLRRSGRQTEAQRRRARALYRHTTFEPRALQRSFTDMLDELSRIRPATIFRPLLLITDEKVEYARALNAHASRMYAHHLTVNSRRPRTGTNPLFASNYLDRELRKDLAEHRRETVCCARNVANMLERLIVYTGWHNYVKPYRIGKGTNNLSHAEMAGIPKTLIQKERQKLFQERAFLSRLNLSALEKRLWLRGFATPLKKAPEVLPAFAFD